MLVSHNDTADIFDYDTTIVEGAAHFISIVGDFGVVIVWFCQEAYYGATGKCEIVVRDLFNLTYPKYRPFTICVVKPVCIRCGCI